MKDPQAIILMGVSGCGKTRVGFALCAVLKFPFYDGDDFHPPENVAKMAAGQPLDDQDRAPWLSNLQALIHGHLIAGKSMILACSALKEKYRTRLSKGNPGVVFVYLHGDFDLIYQRLTARSGHYMPAGLLRSQFEALEPPKDAIIVEINQSVENISEKILTLLSA